ncbi:MAG: hypothetical protein AAFV37_02775 [Pseudomonadota bacterium]
MHSARLLIQDIFCANWLSKRSLSRMEISRALNHRSHRRWMVEYLERKSELARLNLIVALSLIVYWLKHHINFRSRQVLNGAWLATPALAIDHARAALKHYDAAVREDGLAILAYFGDRSSLDLIRSLFKHADPETRQRAHLAARAIEREMPILFVAPSFSR